MGSAKTYCRISKLLREMKRIWPFKKVQGCDIGKTNNEN
jgi:hypothetical protein